MHQSTQMLPGRGEIPRPRVADASRDAECRTETALMPRFSLTRKGANNPSQCSKRKGHAVIVDGIRKYLFRLMIRFGEQIGSPICSSALALVARCNEIADMCLIGVAHGP